MWEGGGIFSLEGENIFLEGENFCWGGKIPRRPPLCMKPCNNIIPIVNEPSLLMDMLSQDFCYSASFYNIADQAHSMPKLSK